VVTDVLENGNERIVKLEKEVSYLKTELENLRNLFENSEIDQRTLEIISFTLARGSLFSAQLMVELHIY
jgi:hypothetical protein